MRVSVVFLAMILSVSVAACSNLSERDLADLQSPNDMVKRQAIQKIAKGERFSVSLVNRLFFDGIIEKRAVGIMVEQLREGRESEDIQLTILRALGEIRDRNAVPGLNQLLSSEDKYVRYNATKALAKIG